MRSQQVYGFMTRSQHVDGFMMRTVKYLSHVTSDRARINRFTDVFTSDRRGSCVRFVNVFISDANTVIFETCRLNLCEQARGRLRAFLTNLRHMIILPESMCVCFSVYT
jgi:hypothetical protein